MTCATRRLILQAVGYTAAATSLRGPPRAAFAASSICGRAEPPQPLLFSSLNGGSPAMARRFAGWMKTSGTSRQRPVQNLVYNFYDPQKKQGEWIYPMLSGKAILWHLQRHQSAEAEAIASSLLRWQQSSQQGKLVKSYGAFPSKIETTTTGYKLGERFYSGDNLVILEALVALYERTKHAALLNAAIGIGTWITETMCKGKEAGLWVDDHGAPMHFVTSAGAFSNDIHGSVEMLWIGALHRLGKVTSETAYCSQAERAFSFLMQGQYKSGAFLDRYEPGFPAKRYNAGRWKPYQAGQVISDNVLRSALGLCRFGFFERAQKFFDWLKVPHGAVPAYLNIDTGQHGFGTGKPYYDVTSSGLHRSLCQWLGKRQEAERDSAFLSKIQHKSGGWYWGLIEGSHRPVRPQMAPIAGFWATADLSRRV